MQRLHTRQVAGMPCLEELVAARDTLFQDGYSACPSWQELWEGARPQPPDHTEPGEWRHGWQFHASIARETRFRAQTVLPSMSYADQAWLESRSGRCSGRHLTMIPTSPESTYTPERFRALLQRRLRLPLAISSRYCNGRSCRAALDGHGDHRSACSRAGRLLKRGSPVERMWARVCREAGGRVRTNVFLRDMNLHGISGNDGRRIEVVVNGLPVYSGKQVAIDATIVSPLRATGQPIPGAASHPGTALNNALRKKRRTYPELAQSSRCHLLVAAVETGGRWNEEAYRFLVVLAKAKARASPAPLRRAVTSALLHRCTGMIAFAVHDAYAASLLEESPAETLATDGEEPPLASLLDAAMA